MQRLEDMTFRIPEGWNYCKVADLGKIVTGNTPPTSHIEYYGQDHLWATPIDLGNQKYIAHTQTMLSHNGFQQTRYIPKYSVLVVCIGSTIGKVGIAVEEMATNQQVNSIICDESFGNEFIYYQMLFNENKIRSSSNQLAIPIINKKDFGNLRILVASNKKVQHKIGVILSKVDDLIQKTDQIIEQTQRLKKGLMLKLFTKGIDHHEFKTIEFYPRTITEKIPTIWKTDRLRNLLTRKPQNGVTVESRYFGRGFPIAEIDALYKSDFFLVQDNLRTVPLDPSELTRYKCPLYGE